jgi:hypothetical protein
LLLPWDQSHLHGNQGIKWSPARCQGWAWCGGLSIHHLLYRENGGAAADDTASGTWGGSRAAVVQRRDGWATRGVFVCARRPCVRSTSRLCVFGVNCCRLGTGAQRLAMRRQQRRLRRGKRMASNFSVLQQRL